MTTRTAVAVYVCTFQRNAQLQACISGVARAADLVVNEADVGLIVVDDNPDGRARPVAESYDSQFTLGVRYVHVGSRNIATARNAGLEAALQIGEWVAMTDDDCIPDDRWLLELLRAQAESGVDAVTGPMVRVVPDGSPRWLTLQPFLTMTEPINDRGSELEVGYTNNSMIRTVFLRDHPDVRFDPSLGQIGGEDMVFYRTARSVGLRIAAAPDAIVRQVEDGERCTFRYRLRWHLWMGNTAAVTTRRSSHVSRMRLVARGARRSFTGLVRPVVRLLRRQTPQLRFSVAIVSEGIGLALGAVGVELEHR